MSDRGTDAWRDEVLAWVAETTGLRPTGEVEQRHRAWSTVLRIPTVEDRSGSRSPRPAWRTRSRCTP